MTHHNAGEDPKSLGDMIRATRMKRGMSLRKLAAQVGCSPPFVSDIELGRRFPSKTTLALIASALDIDLYELEKYDSRDALLALKRLADRDPTWIFALRTQTDRIAGGKLTAESLMKLLDEEGEAQ